MTLKRFQCPAYPMCSATYVVHFPDGPGPNSWGTTVRHVIPRGSMVNQPCPASQIRVRWDGEIKDGDRGRIDRAGADWVKRTADALRTRTDRDLDKDVEDSLRELLQIGRPPELPRDTYFPGRPADVPEPGIGERPTGPVPWDITGGFLGRAAVDNARDQLRTLISMAIEQMGSAQDTLAKMTAMAESIAAHAEVVREHLNSSAGLVAAAIGSGGDVPEPARRLQAQLQVALSAVTLTEDGLTEALKVKIEQTFSQVASGIEAAREYRSIP